MSVLAFNSNANLFGWYLGWIIGAGIITVIVAEVAAILRVARIIGGQAQQAEEGLQVAYEVDRGEALVGDLIFAQGIGRTIPHPVRAVPRWNTAAAKAPAEATHE